MNKEEYLKKRDALRKQLEELKAEYIKTNSPIKNGTKVKISGKHWGDTMHDDYAYLVGYTCEYDNVVPILKKIKKDGTPSMVNYWRPNLLTAKIEPCE